MELEYIQGSSCARDALLTVSTIVRGYDCNQGSETQRGADDNRLLLAMPFLFLSLPGEVRNQILRLLLIHRTPIIVHHFALLHPPNPTSLNLSTNILLTDRATYNEGRTILYGENTFQAHPMLLTRTVFALCVHRPVQQSCVSHVRRFHIRVRLDSDPFYSAQKVQEAFTNADELEVEVFRASFEAGSYRALEGYAGVRGIRKARVYGSVEPVFAQWLEQRMMSKDGEKLGIWEERGFAMLESLGIDTTKR